VIVVCRREYIYLLCAKHGSLIPAVSCCCFYPLKFTLILTITLYHSILSHNTIQCKSKYDITLPNPKGRCPILAPLTTPLYQSANVTLRTKLDKLLLPPQHFSSLAKLWSDWYKEYIQADLPRLIIRYEDTLLHADLVMKAILDCAGQTSAHDHHVYPLVPAKKHGKPVDMVSAMFKMTNTTARRHNLNNNDIRVAKSDLDKEVMRLLGYSYIEPDDAME
jgi:hypothetical protein